MYPGKNGKTVFVASSPGSFFERYSFTSRKTCLFLLMFVSALLQSGIMPGQAPQKVSYQSLIRDATGGLVVSAPVGIRVSILQGTAEGSAVYVETHTLVTNVNGLATLEIGAGTPGTGTFSGIDWGNGPYFLKVETDPEGGTSYTVTGTSEVLSVPYALHAGSSATADDAVKVTGDQTVDGVKTFNNDQLINGLTVGRGGGDMVTNTAVGTHALYSNTTGIENTAIGHNALYYNIANLRSTAIGYMAMTYVNNSAQGWETFNTAVGYKALMGCLTPSANTGTSNTAIGDCALMNNSSGLRNTAVGNHALFFNSSGCNNTAIGCSALFSNLTGNFNIAIGRDAQYYSSGSDNIAIGFYSLYNNKANSRSIAIGSAAMVNADNREMGRETCNIAIGWNALHGSPSLSDNTGQYNTAIGDQASYSMSSGNSNTTLGKSAGYSLSSGSNNICVGYQAGNNLTTGSYNVLIGNDVQPPSNTANHQMVLGNASTLYGDLYNYRIGIGTWTPHAALQLGNVLANRRFVLWESADNDHQYDGFGVNSGIFRFQLASTADSYVFYAGANASSSNELLRIQGDGVVCIGYDPSGTESKLVVGAVDASNEGGQLQLNAPGGTYTTAWFIDNYQNYFRILAGTNTGSSATRMSIDNSGNLKIHELGGSGALYSNNGVLTITNPSDQRLKDDILDLGSGLDQILHLRPVSFTWKSDGKAGIGFIAQEVEAVIPELVSTETDGMKGIYSLEMIPYLVNAIKEQQKLIETQEQSIKRLEAEMEEMKRLNGK